ncbi:MAG: ankyrin repeat domain-containing protein [Alphaproteobacteria bacterium]
MDNVTETMRRDFTTAAWNGQVDVLEATLAVYPDAIHWKRPGSGLTALIHAVASGSLAEKAFPVLVSKGSDINATDDQGWTALMYAAENGGKDMAIKLLDAGADTTLRNKGGCTAVHVAEEKNTVWSLEIAKIILAHESRIAEKKQREVMTMQAEVAQLHSGLAQPIAVRRPLDLKR